MLNIDKTPEIKNHFVKKTVHKIFSEHPCNVDYAQFTLTVPWKPVCDQ